MSDVKLFLFFVVLSQLAIYRVNLADPNDEQKTTSLKFPSVSGLPPMVVTSILHEPYLMLKKTPSSGQDQYEGYIKDLLDLLSSSLGVKFEIRIVKDGSYGYYKADNRTWTGMIGEVLRNEVDMAAADLTITSVRHNVVDFIPYKTLGITMLLKKPYGNETRRDDPSSSYFFLNGFSTTVWLCILLAYVFVSIVYFFVSKFTQLHQHPIGIIDGLSYSFGTIFFRKNNMRTRIFSVKFLNGIWWMFTFFLVVLYISSMSCNIIVHLLGIRDFIERQYVLTKSCVEILEEYLKTGKPEIGLMGYGSTYAFFKNTKLPLYALYGAKVAREPQLLTRNYMLGLERVRQEGGNYAFLMESTVGRYFAMRDCDVYIAPETFDTKQYGLAFPHESPYKLAFQSALLRLQESGKLTMIENKWWVKYCEEEENWLKLKDLNQSPLSLSQMSGVFYFLLIGIALVLIIFGVEMFVRRKVNGNENLSPEERQELTDRDSNEDKNMLRIRV